MAWGRTREIVEHFAQQFEPNGDGWDYRLNSKAAPVRVTSDERDRFIAAFGRQVRFLIWGFAGAAVVLVLGGLMVLDSRGRELSDGWLYAGTGMLLVPFLLIWRHFWRAPARELARRHAHGKARTWSERRRLVLGRMSWGQLATNAVVGIVLIGLQGLKHNLLAGWYRLWLVLGALIVVMTAWAAVDKWRLERRSGTTE